MASKEAWIGLAQRALQKGSAIFEGSHFADSKGGLSNPAFAAIALLARTLGNVNAAILLLNNGCTVEARTLVRCCYENFFWLAALAKQGEDFIAQIRLDDTTNRIKRGKALLQWSSKQLQAGEFEQRLADFVAGLEGSEEKLSAVSLFNAAGAGGIGDAYVLYRELSTDAAHPSATSLSRHIAQVGDNSFTLQADPLRGDREDEDTLELLCSALIGCCSASEEILSEQGLGEPLGDIASVFRSYSDSNKVARGGNGIS